LNKALAAAGVALVVALVLFNVMRQRRETPRPREVVLAVIDSARAGDVDGYLDGFVGEMRDKLNDEVRRDGREGFSEYLRQRTSEIAGVYIQREEQLDDGQVQLDVELVFPSRAEKQRYVLVEVGRAWKISDIQIAEYSKPLEEYGAHISDLIPREEELGKGD